MDHKSVIQPLLTDYYQISMAYAYWNVNKFDDKAVFDLYFRKNPFNGEFTLFCGLSDCLDFMENFFFNQQDVDYIKTVLGCNVKQEFLDYLSKLTTEDVVIYAIEEGSVVFPRVPMMRIEGPLIVCQILETTLLNLVNYASLVATNAARFRLAAGPNKQLLEFGLRRAQGPDGALSASKYTYVGGFDATSNMLAGKLFNIPVKGTHAHAYVTSFNSVNEIKDVILKKISGNDGIDLVQYALDWRSKLAKVLGFLEDQVNQGEFASFIAYALSFPTNFLCLVDTYNVLKSGVPNFCAVALALSDAGYKPIGIRIDSGDLAYISVMVRECFTKVAKNFKIDWFAKLTIVASNDINEDTIISLNQQGHEIDCYGIGTHLVTCQKQPALGCVYKMVEINDRPTIKLSEDIGKMTIPGRKDAFRLYGKDGTSLLDFMQRPDETVPACNERLLCRHPYQASKRAYVSPNRIEALYKVYWKNGKRTHPKESLSQIRERALASLNSLRQDHKRTLNPTPYKVSVSDQLYHYTQEMWLQSAPIGELS